MMTVFFFFTVSHKGSISEFSEGDLFVLRPGTPYAAKNEAGTRVLFIKSPGINDKTEVVVDVETQRWLLSWE